MRLRVRAVRAWDERIQGWAIELGSYEIDYYDRSVFGRLAHQMALTAAHKLAEQVTNG